LKVKSKIVLAFIVPVLLSANINYMSNYNKELALLESLDIKPSFLYDPIMECIRLSSSSKDNNRYFFNAFDSAYLFIPTIKNILVQNKIPKEFLYLAMTESNFSAKAHSNKKAAGLWQFMPSTARDYNLKIDTYVDERRDLIKSTKPAVKFLKQLHSQFGKWYLAAIAYNCGAGRLSKAIKKAGSDELSVLLDEKKKYIPKESRNYIRKIVAFALMGNDEQFLLESKYEHLLNVANTYNVSTVKLPAGESLNYLAYILDMPLSELKKLNRHLKYGFVPPNVKEYSVYIPYEKLSLFKQRYSASSVRSVYYVHEVKSGESLYLLSRRYGIPYKIIMRLNNLKTSMLRIKQKLIIPTTKKFAEIRNIYKDEVSRIEHRAFKHYVKNEVK